MEDSMNGALNALIRSQMNAAMQTAQTAYKQPESKLSRAQRIASEIRARKGMVVKKTETSRQQAGEG